MSKFGRKGKKKNPEISTASLPDIIFMLLFFFMVVTVMREDDPKVKISKPNATETEKLEKKSLVDYINVGPPVNKILGTEPLIQLDDSFADLSDIRQWIEDNRERRDEAEKPAITTSLKVDKDTRMGIVTDIKQELREANALKINYSVNKGSAIDN
ncbi:biopolymer transporter ExbD [Cryomorpha ignava]|uniref:Biopolymer transporter ExbD n=1 Tax=Cryomorpha ignava TaxID=101383 RepID=A0A7K3WQW9_9FLAO|nr:biopolymer transporter ExbD [Cryomorpha ignava]NEN23854.1 biopolymer transporter ExbD [Cryomorpha ignava]